jgi:pyruvate dehydrogenase E2 component (dihydrolipoamide acetyltransferase)
VTGVWTGPRPKYPTAAFAAVGAPEKPFHKPDLGTPCCETKVRALKYPAVALATAGAPKGRTRA